MSSGEGGVDGALKKTLHLDLLILSSSGKDAPNNLRYREAPIRLWIMPMNSPSFFKWLKALLKSIWVSLSDFVPNWMTTSYSHSRGLDESTERWSHD